MMLPIAIAVINVVRTTRNATPVDKKEHNFHVALLLSVAYGASLGGVLTLIGTPPNGIALQYINSGELAGVSPIDFGEWTLVMTPLMLLILVISWLILRMLFPFTAKKVNFHIMGGAKSGWRTYVIYGTLAVTILLWMFEKVTGINSYVVALFPIGVLH